MVLKKAVLYLRVSTLDQHPETQRHDIEQLAKQRGLEITEIYEDRISGASASRPGRGQSRAATRGQLPLALSG